MAKCEQWGRRSTVTRDSIEEEHLVVITDGSDTRGRGCFVARRLVREQRVMQ